MVASWLPFRGFRMTYPQVKRHADLLPSFTPHISKKRPRKGDFGVVATSRFFGTGYHLFPQVRAFTPHTGGIYSPSLATRVVATFRLPTGYHPKALNRLISPYVAARADTRWTREHRSEKREPLSGSSTSTSSFWNAIHEVSRFRAMICNLGWKR